VARIRTASTVVLTRLCGRLENRIFGKGVFRRMALAGHGATLFNLSSRSEIAIPCSFVRASSRIENEKSPRA
jgi:hypothetical protein